MSLVISVYGWLTQVTFSHTTVRDILIILLSVFNNLLHFLMLFEWAVQINIEGRRYASVWIIVDWQTRLFYCWARCCFMIAELGSVGILRYFSAFHGNDLLFLFVREKYNTSLCNFWKILHLLNLALHYIGSGLNIKKWL